MRIARRIGLERAAVLVMAGNVRARDGHVADMAAVDLVQQLAEQDFAARRLLGRALEQRDKRQHQQEDDHPEGKIAQIRVHRIPIDSGARPIICDRPACSGFPFKGPRDNCQGKGEIAVNAETPELRVKSPIEGFLTAGRFVTASAGTRRASGRECATRRSCRAPPSGRARRPPRPARISRQIRSRGPSPGSR